MDGRTSEISRFAPLLDMVDLTPAVVTADPLHSQRAHVAWLYSRAAHWVLTVKGNRPDQGMARITSATGGRSGAGIAAAKHITSADRTRLVTDPTPLAWG